MTTPAVSAREPKRVGAILPELETRPAPCPDCGQASVEVRYGPMPGISAALKERLEAERPYIAQRCSTCIARREADEQHRALEKRIELAVGRLEIPALYADVTLDTFDVHRTPGADRDKLIAALAFARTFVARWPDVPPISVFAGGCGTGKGHLAWSIAKELAATRGVIGCVTVLSDTIRDLREAWNTNDGPTEAQRLGKYRAPELLIIDEVSRHAFFGQPQQHLYDLVAWREVRLKPTILTTNEVGDDLSTVLGPALSSRAAGADGFVHFGTTDYRVGRRRSA
jgi:DNA replication protein DnaC